MLSWIVQLQLLKTQLFCFGKNDRFVWWDSAQLEQSKELEEEASTVHHLDVLQLMVMDVINFHWNLIPWPISMNSLFLRFKFDYLIYKLGYRRSNSSVELLLKFDLILRFTAYFLIYHFDYLLIITSWGSSTAKASIFNKTFKKPPNQTQQILW